MHLRWDNTCPGGDMITAFPPQIRADNVTAPQSSNRLCATLFEFIMTSNEYRIINWKGCKRTHS
jgi:hypothetical protein